MMEVGESLALGRHRGLSVRREGAWGGEVGSALGERVGPGPRRS